MFNTFIYDLGFISLGFIVLAILYAILKIYSERQDRVRDERDEREMREAREKLEHDPEYVARRNKLRETYKNKHGYYPDDSKLRH